MLELSKIINKTKDLNLIHDESHSHSDNKYKDEIGVIVKAIESLRDSLREIIGDLKNSSMETLEHSSSVANSVQETEKSIEAVTNVIGELALISTEQAN